MVKHTLERLQRNPNVSQVIDDGIAVICICGKRIVLKSKYNEAYLDSHANGPGCNRSSGTCAITEFFASAKKIVIPEQKRVLCKGLREDIHLNYINRVQFISLYGDQQEQLNEAERMQAKWKIEGKAVYAQNCETYTSNISEVCNQCTFINSDQVFRNALNKRPSVKENKKFIPKSHLSSHPLSNYLSNPDIAILATLTQSDNQSLGYSSLLGCVVGSTLPTSQTYVQSHDDVYTIIDKIKSENAIASQVRVYLLQIPISKFLPSVIALIPNCGKENTEDIFKMHQDLLKMAAQLKLSILAFGADDVGPVISISDPLHAKKDAQNALFSACYDHIVELSQNSDSILYKRDVENVDRQDDGAAYRLFCSSLLKQVSDQNFSVNKDKMASKTFNILTSLIESMIRGLYQLSGSQEAYQSLLHFVPNSTTLPDSLVVIVLD
ncbi:11772_t:CDS:2 [Gigaspora rosea]|nr:11772_t:CDS:2 [Gigaspora rosea]